MNLDPLFHPRSLAVIGLSSSNDAHPANVIFTKNLLRYPARVYGINPKGGTLFDQTIHTDIALIPEKVDLAVIAVRAELVNDVLGRCIAAGVESAVIISGGFAESGRSELQEELANMARKVDFPFVGPNCLGIYAPGIIDTFFLPSERMVQPSTGDVAIISQSGGVLVDLMVKFAEEGIGISSAVSIGNKALLREIDFLDHFAADPKTRVIALYIEGFAEGEGRTFVKRAKECGKPVVVMKAGRTEAGGQAVSSHTASLAGNYRVFSAALDQFGILEAKNDLEMVSFCEGLSCYPTARTTGKIGIISGSGGHGALAVDACLNSGFSVPHLSEPVKEGLREKLSDNIRAIAALNNPVDLTGSAMEHDFVVATEYFSTLADIDCLLLLLLPYLPGISSDIGARLSQIHRKTGKPLVAYVPHVEKYQMLIEGFALNRVPVASSIESAVMMASAIRKETPC
ncbi:MAG: CoA-binding protein [Proteobacteria bacterium]|nr:CoA-binding protein [Pseudomonadota bacterium]MBU1686416.1 CoA-binding protein [Pseudomonadota bacterium]